MQKVITDDLDALLEILPPQTREKLKEQEDFKQLIEVVLDLGRPPEARFLNLEVILDQREVSDEDIEYVISRIGSFGDDNRAGIERTLHREKYPAAGKTGSGQNHDAARGRTCAGR